MLIPYDPDEYETVSEYHPCAFHREHPKKPFAGCTCSGSFYRRRRSPEEIARVKAVRATQEET